MTSFPDEHGLAKVSASDIIVVISIHAFSQDRIMPITSQSNICEKARTLDAASTSVIREGLQ